MAKKDIILIIDDGEIDRKMIYEIFREEYIIIECEDGESGYQKLVELKDRICVVLLDLIMPKMNGIEVIQKMIERKLVHKIPIVMITSEFSNDVLIRAYEMGVSDVIRKPFDMYIAHRRIVNVIELFNSKNELEHQVKVQTRRIERQTKNINELSRNLIATLSTVVEFRSMESGQHINRVRYFTESLLRQLTLLKIEGAKLSEEEIEIISSASALHDVGKISIPDNILLKPGRLTPDEFNVIKTHTTKGCDIIEKFGDMQDKDYYQYCYDICRYHHERYDGRGYPDGLKGEEIPLAAQVVAVADVYDALVSERVYKKAFSKEEAFAMILNGECGAFSPAIMECFKRSRKQMEQIADKYIL